ncbi:MAG TPA: GH3 auxin-responsive promoter family protein, partial [Planctomycetaceae bacterium]
DLGLVSSEGRHTIPVSDDIPAGVLLTSANFYEFVPVDETNGRHPCALEGHELAEGRDYHLLMTTSSGYYRFNIGDIVRCRGFVGQAPILEFLQKGDRCGDLEGEKVTEHQFVQAAGETATALGIHLGFVTAVPTRPTREPPCYVFIVEHGDMPEEGQAQKFLEAVDRGLAAANFLYGARRREQVLGPPRLLRIPTGAWSQFIEAEIARRGTGDVQYKHPGLVQDENWLNQFSNVEIVTMSNRQQSAA